MIEGNGARCGYVALVGRPNVGKSTLLNHMLGQKISITSRKPQTTRHRILGIQTEGTVQAIYLDTPGIHQQQPKAINRIMNRAATSTLRDADVVVMVVDGLKWNEADDHVLAQLQRVNCPVILALNKVDTLEDKARLLPHLEWLASRYPFCCIVPVSALKHIQLKQLQQEIHSRLPESEPIFPEDQITDRSTRFLVAEIVREKLMRQLGRELPYACSVEIEAFQWQRGVCHISALILVDKKSQKVIVIGDHGARLRKVGMDARKDIEILVEAKVMLNLWVKVKQGWADDDRALRSLGYEESDR